MPHWRQADCSAHLFSIVRFLEDRAHSKENARPFFLCLYNLGTHAWQDVRSDGVHYGDGSNVALNSVRNLDESFGRFWRYFQLSPFAEDTVVIFTADHCHFPSKEFIDAFDGDDFQKLFVDAIPLIVYDPTRELPKGFDARSATSVDFAPTLIHLLGLPNHENPFMGTSLFDPASKAYADFGISSAGQEYFLVHRNRIHEYRLSDRHREKLKLIRKVVRFSQQVEVTHRLWVPERGDAPSAHP